MTSAPSFRLLPVEATEAMINVGSDAICGGVGVCNCPRDEYGITNGQCFEAARAMWAAMVSAAPVMAEATGKLPEARCSQCDNGIELRWSYCPWCGEVGDWPDPPSIVDDDEPTPRPRPAPLPANRKPHQGSREMERRRRQMAKAKATHGG